MKERRRAEEQLQDSLSEKEVLLKEVHHRVKNNLQIISSIINLQLHSINDNRTIVLLRDCQNRIKAMAFIHDSLYQSDNFSKINIKEYITKLTKNTFYSYTPKVGDIYLKLNTEHVLLDIDQAIPCGLIVNELLTNVLKHAFDSGWSNNYIRSNRVETITKKKERNGSVKKKVQVSLNQIDKYIYLSVSDNGKGIPEGLDMEHTESLGYQLIYSLVKQLKGNISIKRNNGTDITVNFKERNNS